MDKILKAAKPAAVQQATKFEFGSTSKLLQRRLV